MLEQRVTPCGTRACLDCRGVAASRAGCEGALVASDAKCAGRSLPGCQSTVGGLWPEARDLQPATAPSCLCGTERQWDYKLLPSGQHCACPGNYLSLSGFLKMELV